MKKLTSLIAILLVACVAAQATPLFQETFATRRGDTYIAKYYKDASNSYWPYASQWFTGYPKSATENVTGNQYDNDYTNVASYTVSIRGKKINEEANNTVGLYFGANKVADQNYVRFEGALPNVPEGATLHFLVCAPPDQGISGNCNLNEMQVKINNSMAEVPATTIGAPGITSEVVITLPAGQIDSIKFAFNNTTEQKFIPRFWIEAAGSAIDNVTAAPAKATKVIENGQLFIIREGIKYNAAGAIVK